MSKNPKAQNQQTKASEEVLVKVIYPHKEEGWFCFTEYEIPLSMLQNYGKVISKTNPDIFAIFKDQVTYKIRDLFGL